MQKISTCLWFATQASDAAEFYTSIFDGSSMGSSMTGPDGNVITVDFQLEGRQFMALNGAPSGNFTEAVSLVVNCDSQEEVDRYWAALLDGGVESQCGWLKDRFGVSWQIVPTAIAGLLNGPDHAGSLRAMQAMLKMRKLDINILQRAYDGV